MEKITVDMPLIKSLVSLASIIEARDAYTGGHIWRVSQYTKLLALEMNYKKDILYFIELGGLIHDLGKIGIADAILNKRGKLSDDEYEIMKKHPVIGNDLIAVHPLFQITTSAVAEHHEWINGKGYPRGVDGSEITNIAKLISIADAFDAMTSYRPYRPAMSKDDALKNLIINKDIQFDGQMVDIFAGLTKAGKLDHILGHSNEQQRMLSCSGCGPIIAPYANLKDGDILICPACKGIFDAHQNKDTFEVEWKGTINNLYIPAIDSDIVNSFTARAPDIHELDASELLLRSA